MSIPSEVRLVPFASWEDVLKAAQKGEPLYYHAPMDRYPARFVPADPKRHLPYRYKAQARTIKMWPEGSVGRGRSRTSDPFTADAGHLSRFLRMEKVFPENQARARESKVTERSRISMTYGQVPPWKEFKKDIRRIDPDEGKPYWAEGEPFTMELVNSREIELAEEFGKLDSFTPSRYAHKSGFKGNEKQIYEFVKFLMDQEDAYSGDEGSPGDLASSIMTSLGYEWV